MDVYLSGSLDPVVATQNELALDFDSASFKTLLYDWIITENVSFYQLESPKLHALLQYLQPRSEKHLPTRNTISNTISTVYDKILGNVTETLASAITHINLSFDLWTSGNKLALLGLVASFIDESGEPRTTLLSLLRRHGRHSGYNQAETVGAVIAEYGLSDKLSYFNSDNASSNRTCVEYLAAEFGFEPKERWIRCSGHVLNRCASSPLRCWR